MTTDKKNLDDAFSDLLDIYRRLDQRMQTAADSPAVCKACGDCCRFGDFGHILFVTPLEVDWLVRTDAPVDAGRDSAQACPWQTDAGECAARTGRMFGCRAYFCELEPPLDVDLERERLLKELRELNTASGYPEIYAPLNEILSMFRPLPGA